MSLYNRFETDPKLEVSGIWLDYGVSEDNGKPIRILVARAGGANVAYQKRMESKTKAIRKQLSNDFVDLKQIEEITRDVCAETVILGWENVTDSSGKPIQFSPENAKALFKDLPDLFKDIWEECQKAALFRKQLLQKDSKN